MLSINIISVAVCVNIPFCLKVLLSFPMVYGIRQSDHSVQVMIILSGCFTFSVRLLQILSAAENSAYELRVATSFPISNFFLPVRSFGLRTAVRSSLMTRKYMCIIQACELTANNSYALRNGLNTVHVM